MEHEIFATNLRISKTCRTVKSSKYESGTAHLDNKQYWDTVFTELDGSSRTPVSASTKYTYLPNFLIHIYETCKQYDSKPYIILSIRI